MSELGLQRAAGALGAFVSGVGLADVAGSDRVYAQVRDALNEHEVLFFVTKIRLQRFSLRSLNVSVKFSIIQPTPRQSKAMRCRF